MLRCTPSTHTAVCCVFYGAGNSSGFGLPYKSVVSPIKHGRDASTDLTAATGSETCALLTSEGQHIVLLLATSIEAATGSETFALLTSEGHHIALLLATIIAGELPAKPMPYCE